MEDLQKLFSARQLLIEYLEEHRKTCPLDPCKEHVNAVAFLGHAAGVKDARAMTQLIDLLRVYQGNCENSDCIHAHDDPERRKEKQAHVLGRVKAKVIEKRQP